jgi:hypothetical protein
MLAQCREFVGGAAPKQIGKRLNHEGIKGPFGAQWNPSTIHGFKGTMNALFAACRASTRTNARTASSPRASVGSVAMRRTIRGRRRARFSRLRPRSAMIRLPMLIVDSSFAGVRDGDECRHFVRLRTRCAWHRAQKAFPRADCSGRRPAVLTLRSGQSVSLRKLSERGSRASFRSAPRRTTWRACRVARARCFKTYASSRLRQS